MPDNAEYQGDAVAGAATAKLIERAIVLLLVLGLLFGVLTVLRPFATAILFGTTLAIAGWPLRQALIRCRIGRGFAAALLLLLSILLIALPILLMAPVLTDQLAEGMDRIQAYFAAAPEQPAWLARVPLIGAQLERIWGEVVRAGGNLMTALAPYSPGLRTVLLSAARALADSVVQLILSLIVATALWVHGEVLTNELRDVFRRLGGPTAEQTLDAAAGAIRSVAYGVLGTAIIQAVLLTFGLALAGIPGAVTLGFVGLLLATSQVGAPLLLVVSFASAWWLFGHDHQGWGIFMVGWGLLISTMDNFLKPWLIGLGVHMPMSLTILGVFGGFVVYGFLGLFIGPTLIAASLILLEAWRMQAPRRVHSQAQEAFAVGSGGDDGD